MGQKRRKRKEKRRKRGDKTTKAYIRCVMISRAASGKADARVGLKVPQCKPTEHATDPYTHEGPRRTLPCHKLKLHGGAKEGGARRRRRTHA